MRRVEAGERLRRARPGTRLATWNVEWFPDGRPGKRPKGPGTDVEWLACAITWLDADAVAVQEIKRTKRAQEASAALLRELSRLSGGEWKLALDECEITSAQHVGFLWNAKRVRAGPLVMLPSINPHGEPCKDMLRPGVGLHLRVSPDFDFQFVSLHLKSGTKSRDLELRKRSWDGLGAALATLEQSDQDVVIAGDFNTMGCRRCSPSVSSPEELSALDAALTTLTRVPADAPCSEAYGSRGTLLDHFLLSRSLRFSGAKSRVSGFCADSSCRFESRERPAAENALSDHCPVVLDLPMKAGD